MWSITMEFNEVLKDIKVYEAGKPIELVVREFGIKKDDIIKLASNENPYGASPKAMRAVKKEAHNMNIYPDDSSYRLKEALSLRFGVEKSNVIIGAGSDQVIEFCVRAKAMGSVLMAKTTFAMYEIYAKGVGAKIIKTPSHEHNLEEFYQAYRQNPEISVIFLCLPNNPLGECLDADEVYSFLEKIDKNTLVVIDGAYQEYASFKDDAKRIDPSFLIKRFTNTIYLGTFSKAYGLGGMRVGYGIADPLIINALYKLRPPFNITTLSLLAACEALEDEDFVKESIRKNFIQMQRYEEFAKKNGIKYIKSYTNFITFKLDKLKNSKIISEALLKKGIIVRDLSSYGLNAIRVTIGKAEENDRFFEEWLMVDS